jgi:hypothetical protein
MVRHPKKANTRSFAGIPRVVMDSPDYINLKSGAVRLLLELAKQFNGRNNGDLTVAHSILKRRGISSKETISKATAELVGANLIIRTRQGLFLNPGGRCALYALTWMPINECPGTQLEVKESQTPPRLFSTEHNKNLGPHCGLGSVHKTGRLRSRSKDGKFVSVHKPGRLTVVT